MVVSDLHFDPMADAKLVDRLAAAQPESWMAVFDTSQDPGFGRYGRDTNWRLLGSALRQMRDTLPQPATVLISGDFLAHDFREQFNATASDHSDPAYRAFVRKTMQFIAQQLRQAFPAAPILPALGNNDEDCGDYELQPNGPFLADTLPVVRGLAGSVAGSGLDRDWTSYGNYSARVGAIRVLSTNTNFFSIRYRNACGRPTDGDPGQATLAWLAAELAAARQARERVWLLFHIPPGIDGYATLKKGMCPAAIVPMWKGVYSDAFDGLLRQYADTIAASLAGHTHMDDFRLVGDPGRRYAFALITPAISPVFAQNPGFRTIDYDGAGAILDQTTYYLSNLSEATVAGRGVPPLWQREYTFTEQWGLPRINPATLDRLYAVIGEMPAERDRWRTLYPVSSTVFWTPFSDGGQLAQAERAFHCATGNASERDFRQCYCGGP